MTNVPVKYLPKRLTQRDRKTIKRGLKRSRKAYKKVNIIRVKK